MGADDDVEHVCHLILQLSRRAAENAIDHLLGQLDAFGAGHELSADDIIVNVVLGEGRVVAVHGMGTQLHLDIAQHHSHGENVGAVHVGHERVDVFSDDLRECGMDLGVLGNLSGFLCHT